MRGLLACSVLVGCAGPALEQPPVVETQAGNASYDDGEPASAAAKAVRGFVVLRGSPPTPVAPSARMVVEPCNREALPRNDVRVVGGRLADVLVTLVGVRMGEPAPALGRSAGLPLGVHFQSCSIEPRLQVVPRGHAFVVVNDDETMHLLRVRASEGVLLEQPLPPHSLPLFRVFDATGLAVLTCDIHRWERAFVFVTAQPFVRVTGSDGAFSFDDLPPGSYELEAWHSRYGRKRVEVRVPDKPVEIRYDTEDPPPPENADELP
jgi:hypothetical protein